jgi:hypothetical protein
MSRRISLTTDLLCGLVLAEGSPNQRLMVEMASLEEVVNLVKEDWLATRVQLREARKQLEEKDRVIEEQRKREMVITVNNERLLEEQRERHEK